MKRYSFYKISLYTKSFVYVAAGVVHLLKPDFYVKIIPLWIPWHIFLVFISGIAELVLGLLLLFPKTRSAAAWLIIAMLVVYFFTIHVPMTLDRGNHSAGMIWLIWLRLPIQFLLVKWAHMYTSKLK